MCRDSDKNTSDISQRAHLRDLKKNQGQVIQLCRDRQIGGARKRERRSEGERERARERERGREGKRRNAAARELKRFD